MPINRRSFRVSLGFTNKEKLKKYFKFTDEIPVDWERLRACNTRVKDIFTRLNPVIHESVRVNLTEFNQKIDNVFSEMCRNELFQKLTNNGRNPVDVYYNWLRGYAVCEFFIPAIAALFGVGVDSVERVGSDDFSSVDVFKRTADADLEILISETLHFKLEVQSGFTGANDIKRSKVDRAISVKRNENIDSYLIHFDIYNGQAALYCTSRIDPQNFTWTIKFENSPTIEIPEAAFKWQLENSPTEYTSLVYN